MVARGRGGVVLVTSGAASAAARPWPPTALPRRSISSWPRACGPSGTTTALTYSALWSRRPSTPSLHRRWMPRAGTTVTWPIPTTWQPRRSTISPTALPGCAAARIRSARRRSDRSPGAPRFCGCAGAEGRERMRAAVLRQGRVETRTIEDPVPGPGQVLVRSLACGICASDLHYMDHPEVGADDDSGWSTYDQDVDIVMGHEYCTEIVEYGPDTERRIPVGTRVSSRPVMFAGGGMKIIGQNPETPGGVRRVPPAGRNADESGVVRPPERGGMHLGRDRRRLVGRRGGLRSEPRRFRW